MSKNIGYAPKVKEEMEEAPVVGVEVAVEGEAPEAGSELKDMVFSALEEGLAGLVDPVEAAGVLRELADMLESGDEADQEVAEPIEAV